MILITGASSGIGESCARAFAKEGKPLFLVARREDRLNKIATGLREQFGVECHVAVLDVADKKSVDSFFKSQTSWLEKVTVLVNNAGLAKGLGNIQDGNTADWDVTIDTNVKGLLYITRGMLPFFQACGEGHIVNLGSVAGHYVYPKGNIYCATKFAVHALTEALRIDLCGSGIRVTEISPGMVQTEFATVRLGDEAKAKALYAGMTPLTPDDIADTVVWATSRPPHVNIQEIVVYPTDQASPTVIHRR
jgi:3-hydroxy acid dehydrogenase/malonic semialdehyde reductase